MAVAIVVASWYGTTPAQTTMTWDGICAAQNGDHSWDAECLPPKGSEFLTNWDMDILPSQAFMVVIPAPFVQTVIDSPFAMRVHSVDSEASLLIQTGELSMAALDWLKLSDGVFRWNL